MTTQNEISECESDPVNPGSVERKLRLGLWLPQTFKLYHEKNYNFNFFYNNQAQVFSQSQSFQILKVINYNISVIF